MDRRDRRTWLDMPAPERRRLRRVLGALKRRYGPFDVLTWELAVLVTESWWTAQDASRSALAEGMKRKHGRGRRPTLQAVDRRFRRQGRGLGTFDQVLRRLEELAKPLKKTVKPEDVVAQLRARGGARS